MGGPKDGNGNLTGLVDRASGAINAAYEYSPFGQTIRSVGLYAQMNPFRFSSKYTDDETQMEYFGFRYYDPSNGRFLGRDPAGEQGGMNLFAYVRNNPVNSWDFLGKLSYIPGLDIPPPNANCVVDQITVDGYTSGVWRDTTTGETSPLVYSRAWDGGNYDEATDPTMAMISENNDAAFNQTEQNAAGAQADMAQMSAQMDAEQASQQQATQTALADINQQLSNVGSTVNADIASEGAGGAQAAYSAASDQLEAGGSSAAAAMDNAVQTVIDTQQVAETVAAESVGQAAVQQGINDAVAARAAADTAALTMAEINTSGNAPASSSSGLGDISPEAFGEAWDQAHSQQPNAFAAIVHGFQGLSGVLNTGATIGEAVPYVTGAAVAGAAVGPAVISALSSAATNASVTAAQAAQSAVGRGLIAAGAIMYNARYGVPGLAQAIEQDAESLEGEATGAAVKVGSYATETFNWLHEQYNDYRTEHAGGG